MMKKVGFVAALAVILVSLVSCEKNEEDNLENNPYKALNLTTKSAEFVSLGNTFAFDFIDRINSAEDGDFIISPLSMQFLLGMILDGAQGETADEICSVLGYGAGEVDAVNQHCLSMLEQLPSLDKMTTLSIANAIFVNSAYPILDSYERTVEKYYQAEVANLDFSDGAKALKTMNGWCSKQTNGMIPRVLDEVSNGMLAYLFNAMYFKSQWKEKFPKGNTSSETFTLEDGTKTQIRMMKNKKSFMYQDNDDIRVVRLPYGNGAFAMLVLLPQEGKDLADVTAAMKTPAWTELLNKMVRCDVDLWLPKFGTQYSKELNDILCEMGMPLAFDALKADFGAMSYGDPFLSFVKQDAVIKVDEEGTEAAVISSAGMATAVAPGEQIVFHADRPFLYLITETSTGSILFAGKFSGK